MLSFALYDENHSECTQLSASIRENMAYLSDEELRLNVSNVGGGFREVIKSESIIDMGCLDVSGKEGVLIAEEFRSLYENSTVILIADDTMSPIAYVKPTIMAAGLLLRPFEIHSAQSVIRTFMRDYLDSHSKQTAAEFVVETRDDISRIPFNSIYYFEAKEKKVFVRVKYEEFGYYDTLDNLEKELPDNFVRCHRGYIVNIQKINRIINKDNMLMLEDDMYIPVSRSLKSTIKEILK